MEAIVMASIKEKDGKYHVIYSYKGEAGERKQKWETYYKKADAVRRKLEVELAQANGKLVVSSDILFEDFIKNKYIPTYGRAKWNYSTYDTNVGIFKNHIFPYIGKKKLGAIKPHDIDALFMQLGYKKVGNRLRTPEEDLPILAATTVHYVYVLLKKAFSKAVEWRDLPESPVIGSGPETSKPDPRPIWEPSKMRVALQTLDSNPMLHLAVHFSVKASLRIGEVVALTVDDIDFDRKEIRINKTLQRVTKEALENINPKDLIYVFPSYTKGSQSCLVLKRPKTKGSIRVNYISDELRDELMERLKQIAKNKAFYGEKYYKSKYELLYCFEDGRPIEPGRVSRWFKKWQGYEEAKELDLVTMPFHSLRHTSASIKLAVTGDIKSLQRDLGDTTSYMATDTYSHPLEEQRKIMSDAVDEVLYGRADAVESNPNKMIQEDPHNKTNTELLNMVINEKAQNDPVFLTKLLDALGINNAH